MKRIAFALLPTLALFLLVEAGVRLVYFQHKSSFNLAWSLLIDKMQAWSALHLSSDVAEASRINGIFEEKKRALFSPENREFFLELQNRWKEQFGELRKEVEADGAKLVVLYMPSREPVANGFTYARFFGETARRHGVLFVDLSPEFSRHDWDQLLLLPADSHPGKLAHLLAARKLLSALTAANLAHSAGGGTAPIDENASQLFGDLRPGKTTVWHQENPLAFRVTTNRQGLRNERDLVFPKEKPRLLLLGDSVGFGLYLPQPFTFAAQLERLSGDRMEVANAAHTGYTIEDELALYRERARKMRPDVVILQTCDNDLIDQMDHRRRLFARRYSRRGLTDLEERFVRALLR